VLLEQIRYPQVVISRARLAPILSSRMVLPIWFVWVFLLSRHIYSQANPDLAPITSELRQHHPADALRDAEAALKQHPDDPRLHTLKGLAAKDLNDPRAALAAFQAALRLAPGYIPALEGAAEVSYNRDPVTAGPYVDRLLLQIPGDPMANGMAAMLRYGRGDWSSAADHFARGGEAILNQQLTLAAYADSLVRLGREDEAAPLFRKFVERWPDDRQARYNLAVLEFRRNENGAVVHTLEPLMAAHNAQALSLAAAAYEAAGDTPHAVAALRDAIQQNPKGPQNYLDFAAISFDHSSFDAGIAMLDAGLTQLPNAASLFIARGILLMQTSQVERAERDFETANRLDPSQTFGLEAQGLTDLQRHDLPRALAKVRASLKANPRSAYLHYLAAQILKEQGAPPRSSEAEAAIAYGKQALELDPKLTAARNLLSGLLFESGDLAQAEAQCRAALSGDPSDQEAVYRLILILRRGGDPRHEIAALVDSLKKLRADEHTSQVRLDRYRLIEQKSVTAPSEKP